MLLQLTVWCRPLRQLLRGQVYPLTLEAGCRGALSFMHRPIHDFESNFIGNKAHWGVDVMPHWPGRYHQAVPLSHFLSCDLCPARHCLLAKEASTDSIWWQGTTDAP